MNTINTSPRDMHGYIRLILGCMFSGKCLGKDTPVLMFDGSVKKVQDITDGEYLIGDDSSPRKVLSTTSGEDDLYEIIPAWSEPYVVNSEHVLSLKFIGGDYIYHNRGKNAWTVKWYENHMEKTQHFYISKYTDSKECKATAETFLEEARKRPNFVKKWDTIDIPLDKYLAKTQGWKNHYLGYSVPVNFPYRNVELDPYFLGLWLGDGTSSQPQITSVDQEIIDYIYQYADELELSVRKDNIMYYISSKDGNNFIRSQLRQYDLLDNKHIPVAFKCNSEGVRMRLLAGILDTDGYYDKKGHSFEIVQKNERLLDDIIYLARSLGFVCRGKRTVKKTCTNAPGGPKEGVYYQANISGYGIHNIPTLLPRKKAIPHEYRNQCMEGFNVKKLARGEYYGFTLDGNGRFLLGSFTVTHNTTRLISDVERFHYAGKRCIIIKHKSDTRYDHLAKAGGIVCNNGVERSLIDVIPVERLSSVAELIELYEVIGVMESQFFHDLLIVDEWANNGKVVICDGLDGDFKRENFGDIHLLIPKCEEVIKLQAVCACGNNASFTQKKTISDNTVDIGGADKYRPTCRRCYLQHIDKQ